MNKISPGGLWRNVVISIVSIFLLFSGISSGNAQQGGVVSSVEKPIILKGIYLGMDIGEARKIMEQLASKEWSVTPVDITEKVMADYRAVGGDREIFSDARFYFPFIAGEKGFAIQSKNPKAYYGYISTDASGSKVSRISLSGILVDYIFDTKEIGVEVFVKEFTKYYNLPELSGVLHGWMYKNEKKEYTLLITIWKLIDLKKDLTKAKPIPQIKFN
jgi:hypothetical protein